MSSSRPSPGRPAAPRPTHGLRARLAPLARRLRTGRVALAVLAAACAADPTAPVGLPTPGPGGGTPAPGDTAPTLRREFRGVWIATVANIDWPSTAARGDAARQQAELTTLLDRAAAAGLNAVILHVRPAGDALYRSTLEPWSVVLSGRQGTDPGYDPLAFAVEQAHARGLELHAWFNPYRLGNTRDTASFAPSHLFRARRDLARVYDANVWMDPGEPAVAEHSLAVIRDVVRRYDVDAVHLDDYFYPYQVVVNGRALDFPDSASYARHNAAGLARADWRRENVNRFVQRLYADVHALKPALKVGISPFGIWRPGNPAGIAGLDAYASIYADARRWLQQGWVDYLAPQLYWQIDPPQQSFTALLDWWQGAAQNPMRRHVWPGVASYRVRDSNWPVGEMTRQVEATRARAGAGPGGASGLAFYNATTTLSWNGGAVAQALGPLFGAPALVPASPWLDATAPAAPTLAVRTGASTTGGGSATALTITPGAGEAPRWWAVAARTGGVWSSPRAVWAATRELLLPAPAAGGTPDRVAVWALDAAGNASAPAVWRPAGAVAAR